MLRISGGQAARSIASMFFSETLLTAGLTARTAKRSGEAARDITPLFEAADTVTHGRYD